MDTASEVKMTDEIKPQFMVGSNWDPELLGGLSEMNTQFSDTGRVVELFGSLSNLNPFGTARPAFRIQEGTEESMRSFAARAKQYGIWLNYTANVSMIDPRVMNARRDEIRTFLALLTELGFRRITIAHPLVGEIVAQNSDLPVELSTILQVRDIRQLRLLKERIPTVDKICLDVFKNRDFPWLDDFRGECDRLGITPELLVNEFCIHNCIDRNSCYDIHSLNMTKEETALFARYPMGRCIRLRYSNPVEWIRARFVLPQDLALYQRHGYNHFKISGRTHPTPYILRATRAYMAGFFTGNMLDLWGQLESIYSEKFHAKKTIVVSRDGLVPDFLGPWERNELKTDDDEIAYCEKVLDGTLV